MTAATMISGQPVSVPNTPKAVASTARFASTSLREQIQTERMFASPMRQAPGYFILLIPLVADGSGAPTYWRFGSPNVNSSPAGEPRLRSMRL